jgi:ABC-2 type transport system permease protein
MKTRIWNNTYWLVKREFWEHRGGFFWAPVITGGVFLLLGIMAIITAEVVSAHMGISIGASRELQEVIARMDAGDMSKTGGLLDFALYAALSLTMVVMGFVVFFYCLGALYDDRRDRSILFWKSLPISDTATVLSKVISATVLAPVIACLAGIIVGLLALIMLAITLSFHGINIWQILMLAHPFRTTMNLIGYIPVYMLWSLPTVGWLMLCSAWARGKPFLWAIALPVASGLLVMWFGIMGLFNLSSSWFWVNIVLRGLFSAFPGSSIVWNADRVSVNSVPGQPALDLMNPHQTFALLAAPDIWIGAIVGVVLLAGAIWFRRWRDDS